MDIRVGKTPPIGGHEGKGQPQQAGAVEARVLAVRGPRRGERKSEGRDPLTGRVLVLMIPDGSQLPDDLEKGGWRVLLRFARR